MINLGYKTRTNAYVRAAIGIILGIFVLIMKFKGQDVFALLLRILGIAVIAFGIFTCIYALIKRSKEEVKNEKDFNVLMISAALEVAFGAVLLVFSEPIVKVVNFVVGIALIAFAIWQIVILFSSRKHIRASAFIFPAIVIILGVLVLSNKNFVQYACAAALIMYGVSELVTALCVKKAVKEEEAEKETENVDVPEAEAVKVEEPAEKKEEEV